jgi:thioredoxin reductase
VGLSRQKGNRVSISYRKEKFFRIKKKNEDRIKDVIKQKKITPLFNSNPLEIRQKSVVINQGEKTVEIPNDFVFIFAGGIPPFQMLKDMGIQFGGESKTAVLKG